MSSNDKPSLHAAVFRNTARDPVWCGFWLARHQQTEDLDEDELAAKLGISMENLVLLCLCRTPRSDWFRADLKVVSERTGAAEEVLAQIIRGEQALLRWQEAPAPSAQGWLMAASDGPQDGDLPSSAQPEVDDDPQVD